LQDADADLDTDTANAPESKSGEKKERVDYGYGTLAEAALTPEAGSAMVQSTLGAEWSAVVDPASGNVYYVNAITQVRLAVLCAEFESWRSIAPALVAGHPAIVPPRGGTSPSMFLFLQSLCHDSSPQGPVQTHNGGPKYCCPCSAPRACV
jgi:hypothetical protein